MLIIYFLAGLAIAYIFIKFTVKQAIYESLNDIKTAIKDEIIEGIHEREYREYKKNQEYNKNL